VGLGPVPSVTPLAGAGTAPTSVYQHQHLDLDLDQNQYNHHYHTRSSQIVLNPSIKPPPTEEQFELHAFLTGFGLLEPGRLDHVDRQTAFVSTIFLPQCANWCYIILLPSITLRNAASHSLRIST